MQNGQNLRVNQLVLSAHESMRAGRIEESVRIWEQVRAISPNHPQALFHLGCYFLYRKDHVRARQLLEQAADADPQAPAIALNLAYAYRALGESTNELAAITRALTIDPYFFPALLAKGNLVERVGTSRAAAKIYKGALAIAPPDDALAPELRGQLDHAREIVRENAIALQRHLELRLAPIKSRHEGTNFDRFDECNEIAIGVKKPFTQQPSMLLVPRLPAIQFYADSEFPWLAKLEAETGAIREELLAIMQTRQDEFHPYVAHPDGAPINQWKELNHSPRWSAYFLWKNGERFDEACATCPRTAQVSEAIPVIDAPNFGPTIMFSVLAPRTRIPAHSSVTNARLVVHLPIIVPPGCRFRVGNEIREWREGKAWVFDDTIDHEAWNDSDDFRIILMIDIWNPLLNPAERELIGALLNGMNEYYKD
jgi:aspartyl/asparaginyl beta-hydroxylase (cupin superfamily)/Flp pilus assembly protein TadD